MVLTEWRLEWNYMDSVNAKFYIYTFELLKFDQIIFLDDGSCVFSVEEKQWYKDYVLVT